MVVHDEVVPALLWGHPDDWWDGHDWDYWWSRLTLADRTRLLELGWGDEPAPVLGIVLTSLRGAVYETVEDWVPTIGGHSSVQQRIVAHVSDEFLIWLEEKRAESDWPWRAG